MSEAKHTPGPWHVVRYSDKIEVVGDNGDLVWIEQYGDIPTERGAAFVEHVVQTTIGNAYMSAAAPELLASLKWMVGTAAFGNPGIFAAQQAIAKAEGEALTSTNETQ